MRVFPILIFAVLLTSNAFAQSNYTLEGNRTLVICHTKAPKGLTDENFIKVLNKMAAILAPQKASGALDKAIYFREINKGTVFVVKDTETQKSDETAKKIIEEFKKFAKKENIGQGKCEVVPLSLAWMTD